MGRETSGTGVGSRGPCRRCVIFQFGEKKHNGIRVFPPSMSGFSNKMRHLQNMLEVAF